MRNIENYIQIVFDAINECSLPSVYGGPLPLGAAHNLDKDFAKLGFDSLAYMEFCIAIHCATGIEISLEDVARLKTPRAISLHLEAIS